jgi:uncharacterized protein (TIGR01615 family)
LVLFDSNSNKNKNNFININYDGNCKLLKIILNNKLIFLEYLREFNNINDIIIKLREKNYNLDFFIHSNKHNYTFPYQSIIIHKKFIICPKFNIYFDIYNENDKYKEFIKNIIPETFIGTIDSLKKILDVICNNIIIPHYFNNKLEIPPWRTYENMKNMFIPKYM